MGNEGELREDGIGHQAQACFLGKGKVMNAPLEKKTKAIVLSQSEENFYWITSYFS